MRLKANNKLTLKKLANLVLVGNMCLNYTRLSTRSRDALEVRNVVG